MAGTSHVRSRAIARTVVLLVAFAAVLAGLWPDASSLYDLTGEEELRGQLVGTLHWLNTAIRPQPILAPEAIEPALAAASPFSANTFLEQEVELEKRARILDLLREAGITSIRQEFPWEDIEIHAKGDFIDRRNDPAGVDAWAKYDHIVDLAGERDIAVIARLGNPPSWTRALTDTIGAAAPPDDFNDFGDFAAAAAERYAGRIRHYQIWNEPNGNEEWGKQDVDPEAYTALLCLAYERIKAVDPDAIVLAAALTPTVANDGRHMNDLVFLQRMYDAGAGDCFDIFSAQGYGLWSGPTDQRLRPVVINYPHHLLLRDVMVRNGDAHKPVWISEMGWNTAPEPIPPSYGRVTEEQQARYAVQAFARTERDWPWVGLNSYWFFKRPGEGEIDQAWYYFRMMEPDFTPLPVYGAIAEYATGAGETDRLPAWKFTWQRWRPVLAVSGLGVLFYMLVSHLLTSARPRL